MGQQKNPLIRNFAKREKGMRKEEVSQGTVDEEIRPSESCLSDSNENCKLIACQGKWSPGSLSSLSNEINGYSFHPRPLTFCIRVIAQRSRKIRPAVARVRENSPASSTKRERMNYSFSQLITPFYLSLTLCWINARSPFFLFHWKFEGIKAVES